MLIPSHILQKRGAFDEIVLPRDKRILAVVSKSALGALSSRGQEILSSCIGVCIVERGEPSPNHVDSVVACARNVNAQMLVAVGGGSVLDTAKAASGILTNGGMIEEYLEGVGSGKKMTEDPLPWLAIPTTSGTGAETTVNAVISSSEKGYKKSFRDPRLLASGVVLDPLLTLSVPKRVTAESGMDALTQLIESATSCRSSQSVRDLALFALSIGADHTDALVAAFEDGEDIEAREAMQKRAFLSGVCLANGGLGAAHGIAASLGVTLGIPHGKACALALPHVMHENFSAVKGIYAEIARRLLPGCPRSDSSAARALIAFVEELNAHFLITTNLRPDEETVEKIVCGASGNSMKGNPIILSKAALRKVVEHIFLH